jgi:hypothetical protein
MLRKLIALTAIAALSMALVAVAGAKPQIKHVETKVSLTFTHGTLPVAPYIQDEFSGRVKAKKSCKKKRMVTIDGTALSDTTDSSGDFVIAVGYVGPGTYTATAAAKNRKTNNGTKIVCEKGTSKPVTVP